MSNNNEHDVPPHMNTPGPPHPPPLGPDLQQAMAPLFQAMNANMQAAPPPQAPSPQGRGGVRRQRVKPREPDLYDGTDPSKLRAFLSQVKRVFSSSPQDFANDETKIMYAASYLQGTAFRWFEPNLAIDEADLPLCAYVWNAFEEELEATFGEPNPIAIVAATRKLDKLTMKDTHHVAKYNVKFNEYSALTGFNNRALYAQYYKGLAPRIKDALVFTGRPTNLDGLRNKAQELDTRYWERYWERKDEDRANASSSGNSGLKPSSEKPSGGTKSASTSR